MQIRPKAIEYHCKCITKAENPLRLADDGFGPPRHTSDHMLKKKIICIILKIAIFSAVARSLLAKITISTLNLKFFMLDQNLPVSACFFLKRVSIVILVRNHHTTIQTLTYKLNLNIHLV